MDKTDDPWGRIQERKHLKATRLKHDKRNVYQAININIKQIRTKLILNYTRVDEKATSHMT